MTNTTGKTSPTVIPVLILSPAIWVTLPTIPGPILPPKSPAIARSANIAVPPAGNFLEEILSVPGHMIPTENPHNIHPISPTTGLANSDARPTVRIPSNENPQPMAPLGVLSRVHREGARIIQANSGEKLSNA